MNKKKIVALTLSLCLSLSVFAAASSAQTGVQSDSIINSYSISTEGKSTIVNIAGTVTSKVPQDALNAIANQAAGGEVTIHRVVQATPNLSIEPAPTLQTGNITPYAWYDVSVDYSITKSSITHDNPDAAQQIISVARGAVKKLTSKTTKKVTKSAGFEGGVSAPSGAAAKLNSSLTEEITKEYTTEQTWNGPPEDSKAVSRIFYFTGFKDYGKFTITGTGWPSGDTYGPYKGSYTEPTYYIEWSQDIY